MKGISLSYLPVFVEACGGRDKLVGHDTSWVSHSKCSAGIQCIDIFTAYIAETHLT